MTEERACPRDGSVLESKAVGSAEVLVCKECHGLWLSGYDLAALLRSPYESWKLPWAELSVPETAIFQEKVRCLCRSRALMKIVGREGIRVDLCPDCGALWFDGGELEELIRRRGEKELRGPEDALLDGHVAQIGLDVLLAFLQPP
ncbi:MAG: zf-TFIIB domain-containing protein [Thermoanaerobaculia bacterium]